MFHDREDAGRQLAEELRDRQFHEPLVLAIPRGGVVVGAVLARELNADLDVVLARKLRAPGQPELAIGAIAEDGRVYLNYPAAEAADELDDYLGQEREYQLAEIARRKRLFRKVRPPAPIADRSVIVTDDGIATGATMSAALQVVKLQHARELIVAVPVASPERLPEIRHACDEVICLLMPERFWAIGQFYDNFQEVDDDRAVRLLRRFGHAPRAGARDVENLEFA
jgi:predicted phosphoribosyltransferase